MKPTLLLLALVAGVGATTTNKNPWWLIDSTVTTHPILTLDECALLDDNESYFFRYYPPDGGARWTCSDMRCDADAGTCVYASCAPQPPRRRSDGGVCR